MMLEIRSPRGDVAPSPAIVAAVTVALGILARDAESAAGTRANSRWRAAGRVYDAYDSHVSAERHP